MHSACEHRPATYSYKELAARIDQVLGERPSLSALRAAAAQERRTSTTLSRPRLTVGMPAPLPPTSRTTPCGPITRSASAGGVTVTATAKVNTVVWDMGAGKSATCTGPGTPYADSYGKQSSPTCGHARQGGYTVTATSYWTVDWVGRGQSGTIPLQFSRSTTITMSEVQVIVR